MRNLNLDKYRKTLECERDRLERETGLIEERISDGDTAFGQSELADYDNHPGDMGTEAFEKVKDLALRDNLRDLLAKVEDALKKIEKGTYGECDRCGREISSGRLNAVPWALYCVDCQDAIE